MILHLPDILIGLLNCLSAFVNFFLLRGGHWDLGGGV